MLHGNLDVAYREALAAGEIDPHTPLRPDSDRLDHVMLEPSSRKSPGCPQVVAGAMIGVGVPPFMVKDVDVVALYPNVGMWRLPNTGGRAPRLHRYRECLDLVRQAKAEPFSLTPDEFGMASTAGELCARCERRFGADGRRLAP